MEPQRIATKNLSPYYVGFERRQERRRSSEPKFEKMLKMFGIDRRDNPDRRRQDSSWLLLSESTISPLGSKKLNDLNAKNPQIMRVPDLKPTDSE